MQYLMVSSKAEEQSEPAKDGKVTNHRRHRRTRAGELLVKVRVGDGVVIAKVEDISVGGLFARTSRPIPVGAFVEMMLVRPGREELPLHGVIVDDTEKRAGMAVRFEGLTGPNMHELRKLVLDLQIQHTGDDPDVGVERTRIIKPSDLQPTRDREIEDLRRQISAMNAENERLKAEVAAGQEAQKLAGRLQVEVERMKSRFDGAVPKDVEQLGAIRREAELAWTAIARLVDAVDRLK